VQACEVVAEGGVSRWRWRRPTPMIEKLNNSVMSPANVAHLETLQYRPCAALCRLPSISLKQLRLRFP
jgi:hypothetical protein